MVISDMKRKNEHFQERALIVKALLDENLEVRRFAKAYLTTMQPEIKAFAKGYLIVYHNTDEETL